MKKTIIKRQLALPLPRKGWNSFNRGVLPKSSLTPEEIRVANVIASAQQEMEIEMEIFRGKYPVVERRY